MDKPAKARRRRSIRHLRRVSTGLNSPSSAAAPYGSAWIDQDQETNMDNLVMSLSLLQANDVNDEAQEDECGDQNHHNTSPSGIPRDKDYYGRLISSHDENSPENNCFPSLTQHSGGANETSAYIFSQDTTFQQKNEDTALNANISTNNPSPDPTAFECNPFPSLTPGREGASPLKSKSGPNWNDAASAEFERLAESFSFSPDMPMCWNRSEKYPNHIASRSVADETVSPFCTRLETSDTVDDGYRASMAGRKDCVHGVAVNQYKQLHLGGNVEVERANYSSGDLSLNFSPVPEADKTVDFLLASLSYDSDLSLSPLEKRPNTPEFSHGLLLETYSNLISHSPQIAAVQEQSSINYSLSPKTDGVISNLTYTLDTSDKSSSSDRTYDSVHQVSDTSSLSEEFPIFYNEHHSHDKRKDKFQDSDTRTIDDKTDSQTSDSCKSLQNDPNIVDFVEREYQVSSTSSLSEESPILYDEYEHSSQREDKDNDARTVGEVPFNTDSQMLDSCEALHNDQNFVNFVSDIASELENIEHGEIHSEINSDRNQSDLVRINLNPNDFSSQLRKNTGSSLSQDASDEKQNNKRTRRRSSRAFTREEISNSLFNHNQDISSANFNSIQVSVDKSSSFSSSLNISESDKENSNSQSQESVHCESVQKGKERSEVVKSVLSEVSNDQNPLTKKKRGRKSNSFRKGKDSILIENSGIIENSTSNECITEKHCNGNGDADVGLRGDMADISQSRADEGDLIALEHRIGSDFDNTNANQEHDQVSNDNDVIPMRSLRTRSNRKSWGNVAKRQTSERHQQKPSTITIPSERKQNSDTDLNEVDIGRLEQIYLQKNYVPVQSKTLETIKESKGNGRTTLFGKKLRRLIHFPENYHPSAVKHRMRLKKAKNHKVGSEYCPIDHDDFQIKLLEIQAFIEGSDSSDCEHDLE